MEMLNPKYENQNPDLWEGENWNKESREKAMKAYSEIKSGLTGIPLLDAAEKLNQKIIVEPSTNCFNRSYYENFKLLFDATRTKEAEIALVFVDLNGLKTINDTLGHDQGDKVIKMLVRFLKANFRKGDEIIRLGGDEFLIICHNHKNDDQFEINLQKKVDEAQKKFREHLENKGMPSSGFAAGVAVFNKKIDSSLDNMLKRADRLMYKNKKSMKRTVSTSDII